MHPALRPLQKDPTSAYQAFANLNGLDLTSLTEAAVAARAALLDARASAVVAINNATGSSTFMVGGAAHHRPLEWAQPPVGCEGALC